MNITQLCKRYGLEHHGSLESAWDAHGPTGLVLMQLWHAPNQKLSHHPLPGAQLRVRCMDASQGVEVDEQARAARVRSIAAVEKGARGFAAMSIPPSQSRGAGAWAKYANLERVFPVLGLEREPCGAVFAVLGAPVPASELGVSGHLPGRRPPTPRHQLTNGRASTLSGR
ncbi:hypothetical protein ACFOHT_14835 [Massilia oculi]|jgi:hypothetical protein|uniref:Uncharacterized protein n=1 Tax=Massilia oculi TaxID=945844 RepID=A0A2S2DID0_9BURK|nr:hypothetical protein [Massilia oculi]AWL05098.1 hypothetical protein DIR46_12110 [Massilia oculi]